MRAFSMYGTALARELPVFKRPPEYQGGYGIRCKTLRVLKLDNVDLARDALDSASYVAISLRANPGFQPAVRLLSLASEDRAFLVDLDKCPVEDTRVQALLAGLLRSNALLCCKSIGGIVGTQTIF